MCIRDSAKGNLVTTNQLTGDVTTNIPTADTGTNIPININVAPILSPTTKPTTTSPTTTSLTTSPTTTSPTTTGITTPLSTLGSNVATTKTSPTATLLKGSQIASPLASVYNIPVETYAQAMPNPNQLAEIQNAATGGIIHKASGGDLPMTPKLMHGQSAQHPNLMGWHGAQLFADGGMAYQDRTLPEGHNPQFFSEGGLNAIEHRYVTGDGDGTSAVSYTHLTLPTNREV